MKRSTLGIRRLNFKSRSHEVEDRLGEGINLDPLGSNNLVTLYMAL